MAPQATGAAVSRQEFAAKHGADSGAIDKVKQFAKDNNLTVGEVSAERRTVKLEGTAANMRRAVEGPLDPYQNEGQQHRVRPAPSIHAAAANISYTPRQVAQLYQFPLDVDGTGQTVGILELGGGYRPADLKTYFASLGIKEPNVISFSVDKGKNAPTNPNSADGEVLLDIEVAGAVAPGANIVVYFAPNTSKGFQDALTTAIH